MLPIPSHDGAPAGGIPAPAGRVPLVRTAPALPAAVRWATLIGEVTRLAEAFPGDGRRHATPRRRYGEPALAAVDAPPVWLDDAAAHLLGVLARCSGALPEDAVVAIDAGADPNLFEAVLMTAVVDQMLATRLAWAGRPYWRARPLAARIAGRPLLDDAVRLDLRRAVAAGDDRFVTAAGMLDRFGLAPVLALAEGEDTLRALAPVPVPVPAVRPAPRAHSRRRPNRTAWAVAAIAVATFAAWHTMQWHEMRARLTPALEAVR